MDSQFHVTEKASQSWWKARLPWQARENESQVNRETPYKTIRSCETYSRELYGGNHTHDSVISTWPHPWHVGIITIRGEIWVEAQSQTMLVSVSGLHNYLKIH